MPENTLISPFLSSFMTAIFVFSTIYTAAYYWNQASGQVIATEGLSDNPTGNISFAGSFIDSLLEGASWISPFGFVKFIIVEVMVPTPEIYTFINLIMLRPVGWIVFLFEANFIISKIPTVSSEV